MIAHKRKKFAKDCASDKANANVLFYVNFVKKVYLQSLSICLHKPKKVVCKKDGASSAKFCKIFLTVLHKKRQQHKTKAGQLTCFFATQNSKLPPRGAKKQSQLITSHLFSNHAYQFSIHNPLSNSTHQHLSLLTHHLSLISLPRGAKKQSQLITSHLCLLIIMRFLLLHKK